MRASLAKKLRLIVNESVPTDLSPTPTYQVVPGTARTREFVVPQLQANGTISMVKVNVPTCTFRLALCRRYFTQKFKRQFKKQRQEKQ